MGAWTHLYHTRTWKQLRANHLRLHPLCVKCEESGFLTPGNTVDHVIPHNGDMDLFADPTNLQTLCAPHHSRDKQLEERKGVVPGADEAGLPLDPKHHWFTGGDSKSADEGRLTTGSVPPFAEIVSW